MNKIRDQGMENDIFMLCFKICLRGVDFKIMVPFMFFKNSTFSEKFANPLFEGSTF